MFWWGLVCFTLEWGGGIHMTSNRYKDYYEHSFTEFFVLNTF